MVGGGTELGMAMEVEVIDPKNSSPDKSGDEEVTGDASAVSTGCNGAMVVRVREVSEVKLVEDGKKRGKGGQTCGVAVGEGMVLEAVTASVASRFVPGWTPWMFLSQLSLDSLICWRNTMAHSALSKVNVVKPA